MGEGGQKVKNKILLQTNNKNINNSIKPGEKKIKQERDGEDIEKEILYLHM